MKPTTPLAAAILLLAVATQATELPSVELPAPLARVLRDYEDAWQKKDAPALAALFAEDGFVLANGVPPVRGRAAIEKHYQGQGGPLSLRALAFAADGSTGYIIGGFARRAGEPDAGKFTLTLRKDAASRWWIVSDMDNGNTRPGRPQPDGAQAARRADDKPTVVIRDVTLIDGTGAPAMPNASVLLSGGRIAGIVAGALAASAVPDIQVIDGQGRFLIPGLWDMHTHVAYAGDVTCSLLVALGVTSIRDPGGSLETVDWLRSRIDAGELIGPRIFRAGPLVDGSKPGSHDRFVVDDAEQGRKAVSFLKTRGVDFIKVHNGAPPAAFFAVLAEARRQGLTVVGHIPQGVDPAEAIDAGQHSVEHVVSLFEGALRRKAAAGMSQQAAMAEFTDDEVLRLARKMAARGTWFDPTLVPYWYRAHQWEARAAKDERDKYVTGSLRSYWKNFDPLPDRPEVREALATGHERFVAITRLMHGEGVRMLVGTDLGLPLTYPGFAVHEELEWLVKAGLTPLQAIVAGTRNGAESVGRLGELGTIEAGKHADLVLLDADPLASIANTRRIAAVVANGRVLTRAALDELLAQIAKNAASR